MIVFQIFWLLSNQGISLYLNLSAKDSGDYTLMTSYIMLVEEL